MRICSGAGCLHAVPDDVKLCWECKPKAKTHDGIKDHNGGYDAEMHRLASSPRWTRMSHSVIRSQPMCARCDCRISVLTDHKVPAQVAMAQTELAGMGRTAGYFLRSNLQGLCRQCHGLKTNEDKAHVGDWPDVVEIERLAPKKAWSF